MELTDLDLVHWPAFPQLISASTSRLLRTRRVEQTGNRQTTDRQQTDNRQTTDAQKTHNSRAHGITVYRSADFEPFWSIAPKLRPSHDCFWCAAAPAAAVEIDLFMIFLRSSGIMNARRPRYTTITSFRTMRPNTVRCTQTLRTLDLAAMISPNLVLSAHLTPLFLVNWVGTTTSQLQLLHVTVLPQRKQQQFGYSSRVVAVEKKDAAPTFFTTIKMSQLQLL
jgi:hypothetical protein